MYKPSSLFQLGLNLLVAVVILSLIAGTYIVYAPNNKDVPEPLRQTVTCGKITMTVKVDKIYMENMVCQAVLKDMMYKEETK